MIYNYTKCESVIAKVMADLNISEKNIRITDMREWIFEAVDKIGAPMQYEQKESGEDGEPILKIEDYQVPLPHGVQSIDGVAYSAGKNGPWEYVRSNTSVFKGQKKHRWDCNRNDCHDCKHDHIVEHEHHRCDEFPMPEKNGTLAQLYTVNGMKYLQPFLKEHGADPTYFIKPGWIVTNKKKGFLKIAYKTIATDERGYPLIPDLTSYQEAVYWYVVMKLSFPKFLSGKLGGRGANTAQNTYFYIQRQWNFYRNQAYAEAMMPTAADMESIKNDWNKLVPEFEDEDTFFKHQGEEQIIYNDYYYGY